MDMIITNCDDMGGELSFEIDGGEVLISSFDFSEENGVSSSHRMNFEDAKKWFKGCLKVIELTNISGEDDG